MFYGSRRSLRRMRGCLLLALMATLAAGPASADSPMQEYALRKQVIAGLALTGSVKVAVSEYFAMNGRWPDDLAQVGLAPDLSGSPLKSIAVRRGTIFLVFGNSADPLIAGGRLSLRPTSDERGDVYWNCGHSKNVGEDPKSGAAAPHDTTISPNYLPISCRG